MRSNRTVVVPMSATMSSVQVDLRRLSLATAMQTWNDRGTERGTGGWCDETVINRSRTTPAVAGESDARSQSAIARPEPARGRGVEPRDMSVDIIADIVTFWLSDSRDSPDRASDRREWWYRGGSEVDEEIRARFGALVPSALAGELMGWRATPDGALALVLLLDQFTRNIYRGTVEAYAGDALAFEVVKRAIDRGLDRALHPVARIWLLHPFHHSEDLAEQDRGLALLRALRRDADPAWHAHVERSIKGWTRHRDIVARFGRFPHRNAVLGRDSTVQEQAYMAAGGESFGQRQKNGSATR